MNVENRAKVELLEYLIGIAKGDANAVWRALFCEMRQGLIEQKPRCTCIVGPGNWIEDNPCPIHSQTA